MILLDFSQVALASVMAFKKDLVLGAEEANRNIIRHAILYSVLSNKKKFEKEYGQVVICCDSRKYWRRDVFPNYKAHRKTNREQSDLDWNFIFSVMDEMKQDLIENFPYKVLTVDKAEADDLIAVLVKWSQDNDLVQEGIVENSRKLMIVSSDGDFKQLHQFSNVKQFSPMQKKLVERPKSVPDFIREHIIRGDKGDGVPSVLCADDFFTNKEVYGKAPSVTAKVLEKFSNRNNLNDLEKTRYDRNETLISFEKIPKDISDSIIEAFNTCEVKGSQGKIFKYMISNDFRLLIDKIEDF
jgi:5'-3' exonuclease